MKTTVASSLIMATLFVSAATLQAWPFQKHTSTLSGAPRFTELPGCIPFQADSDRMLELFPGGPELIHVTKSPFGYSSAVVPLPLPDKDPYAANLPNVDFGFGRGAVGDMDGDGDMDIVYSCLVTYNHQPENYNARIVVCRNEGNGSWTRLYQMKDTSATQYGAPDVKLADFDGDGDFDMAETHEGLRIYWNDGTGVFPTATTNLVSGLHPAYTLHLVVEDFDGNGWPDILLAGSQLANGTGRITLVNNSAGAFTAATVLTLGTGLLHFGAAGADMNGDGRPDFLTIRQRSTGGTELALHTNNGGGTFSAPLVLLTATSAQGIPSFQPVDLDQNGVMDIVFSRTGDEAGWLRRTATGSYEQGPLLQTGQSGGGGFICAADLEGDGDVDVLPGWGAQILENKATRMKPAASVALYAGLDTPTGAVRLVTADVNGDGRDDLLASDAGGKRIRWYAGNGTGLSSSYPMTTGSLTPAGVTAGDFNRDGLTDIVYSTTAGTLERAQNNNGLGTLWAFDTIATMAGITEIKSEDMDLDGDADILSVSPSAGIMRYHVNNGAAAWSPQNVDTGLTGVSTFACGQWQAGRRPEIISLLSGTVDSHRHTGSAWTQMSLALPTIITASRGVVFMDLDHDQAGLEAVWSLGSNSVYVRNFNSTAVTQYVSNTGAPITRLATADWDQDGTDDLLYATTQGVRLIPNVQDSAALPCLPGVMDLLSGASVQDVVIMDLNGDPFPDAVAVDTAGELHLITNCTALVDVQVTTTGLSVALPGTAARAASISATGLGCDAAVRCGPSLLNLQFRRSDFVSGADTPGSLLTAAEMAALVDSVLLTNGNGEPGSVTVSLIPAGASLASYSLPIGSDYAGSIGVNGGGSTGFQFKVKLKSTAGSSAVTRFYVDYLPSSEWATTAAYSNALHINPTPARRTGTNTPVRTLIVLDTPSPLDTWRLNNFGSYETAGSAANDADPDGDGIANIMEYLMSQNPNVRGGLGFSQVVGVSLDAGSDVMVADLRLLTTYDSKIKLTLQYSFNPAAGWSLLSTRTGTGAWTGIIPTSTLLSGGGRTRWEFDGGFTPVIFKKTFFRLKVEELP